MTHQIHAATTRDQLATRLTSLGVEWTYGPDPDTQLLLDDGDGEKLLLSLDEQARGWTWRTSNGGPWPLESYEHLGRIVGRRLAVAGNARPNAPRYYQIAYEPTRRVAMSAEQKGSHAEAWAPCELSDVPDGVLTYLSLRRPEVSQPGLLAGWAPNREPDGRRSAFAVSRESDGDWASLGEGGRRIPYSGPVYETKEAAVTAARRKWRKRGC